MLQGLALPTTILSAVEKVLESITGLVLATEQASQDRSIWILFHRFTYDPVMCEFQACKSNSISRLQNMETDTLDIAFRNVEYKVNQNMCNMVVGENRNQEIDVGFEFQTADYILNDVIWDMVESPVREFLHKAATGYIVQPEIPRVA